jgi:hypothetical protein
MLVLTIEEMNQTFGQLKKIRAFEDAPGLNKIKNDILFYSFFFPQEVNAQHREDFYHRINHLIGSRSQDLKSLILTCQAEFSS